MKSIKKIFCDTLMSLRIDAPFRALNKNKMLVIMYHGISKKVYDPPIWTQLPEDTFRRQLQYLKSHYKIISLSEAIMALSSRRKFPEPTALITFDDGYKNNYTIAFPILKEYSIPAAIFLTFNFIGTNKLLWVNELLLLLKQGMDQGFSISHLSFIPGKHIINKNFWEIYLYAVNAMKRMPELKRSYYLKELRKSIKLTKNEMFEDFSMLTWDHIIEMKESGLVDFGVHTANHKILSSLPQEEWADEIKMPKEKLSNMLGAEIEAFCYPNGRPEVDFNEDHVKYLRECGYVCAFTTESSLFNPTKGDTMQISRIPAGNDFSSYEPYFRLNTSGFREHLSKFKQKLF